MGENKGKGMKGRNRDEVSGVGTPVAGVTGATGKLNDGARDGGVGKPGAADSGNLNRQSAEPNDGDTTPALGTGNRSGAAQGRQGASEQNFQSGKGGNLQGGKSLDQDVMGKEN